MSLTAFKGFQLHKEVFHSDTETRKLNCQASLLSELLVALSLTLHQVGC